MQCRYHCIQSYWNETKLYQFLESINPKFDGIKRPILREDQLSSVEVAYAYVRKETANIHILKAKTSDNRASLGIRDDLLVKGEGTQIEGAPNVARSFQSRHHGRKLLRQSMGFHH